MDDVVLRWEDVADNGDEELGNRFSVEDHQNGFLHRVDFGVDVVGFQGLFDLVGHGGRGLVEVDEETARSLH